ncbi:MAG: hypothetical protein GY940_12195 [bacterium]|nr:hypothetical protein [bacterium]
MKLQKMTIMFVLFLCLVGQGRAGHNGDSKKKDPWPHREFAYVKAYLYNLENTLYGKHAIIKENKLDPTVVGDGVLLEPKQVETVVTVTNKDIAGLIQGLSKSYIPHHGFVFYDKNYRPVASITLCFDCEAIRVYPEPAVKLPAKELTEKDIKKLLGFLEQYKQVINELKLPVFDSPFGYTEYGKKRR